MHKFFLTLFLFGATVFVLQHFIITAYPQLASDDLSEIQALAAKRPEILYFGDSTSTFIHPTDADRGNIGDMLVVLLPGYRLGILTSPAHNPEVYVAEATYIERFNKQLKAFIVPINMRVFSPEWDRRPVFQFVNYKASLLYAGTPVYPFLRFLIALKAFDPNPISQEEFDTTPVYSGNTVIGKLIDFESIKYQPYSDENMKRIINYFYMAQLQSDNRQLSALVQLADLMKHTGTKLIFYITPIDYQTGEQYLGSAFTRQLEANTRVIKTTLAGHGVTVLDWSLNLESPYFGWKNTEYLYINEHLNDKGRLWVAKHIVDEVKKLFQ